MLEKFGVGKTTHTLSRFLFSGFLLMVIVFNFSLALQFIFNKPLYPDEFQHTHIAWNMFYNAKVIYAGFWEHHGVVYPVVNFFLFKIFNLGADFSTFFFLRSVSFIYMAVIAAITFHLARLLFKSSLLALLSVSILSSIYYFHLNGIEIRPDQLQNIFWLSGLSLIVVYLRKNATLFFFLSGILFGLAIATNTKSVLGVSIVLSFLLVDLLYHRAPFATYVKKIGAVCFGIACVLGGVILSFYLIGAGKEYILSNYYYNWVMLGSDNGWGMLPFYWKEILHHQFPILVFSCIGFVLLLWEGLKKRNAIHLFFLWVTAGCASTILLGMYSQSFLPFLPLIAILCAYSLARISVLLSSARYVFLIAGPLLVIFLFLPMEQYLLVKLNNIDREPVLLQEQKDLARFMIKNTDRTEPVFFFWNVCGGYVFNEDVQYYWSYNRLHGETARAVTGYDVYGVDFIRALENKKVRFIIADPGETRDLISASTQQYIAEKYHRVNKCLLERNEFNG